MSDIDIENIDVTDKTVGMDGANVQESTPGEVFATPDPRPGPRSSKARRSVRRALSMRSASTSSAASQALEGGADREECVTIGSENEESSEGEFRTPQTSVVESGASAVESRGRLPKDPAARNAKMEHNKLQKRLRILQAYKEKAEERARHQEELLAHIRAEGGAWDAVESPARAPPPAVNLPALEEVERQAEGLDESLIATMMMRHADVIDNAAYVAANLSGTAKKKLRLAALVMKAGTKALGKGALDSPGPARESEALHQKVERLEREVREKDARIAELERRYDELRDAEVRRAAEGSPNPPLLIPRIASREGERVPRALADGSGGPEVTPASRAVGPSPSSPGWLPQSQKKFEALVGRTVLGQLSTFMDRWMREEWEPRALELLKGEGATHQKLPTPAVKRGVGAVPGAVQVAAPGPSVGPAVDRGEETPGAGSAKRSGKKRKRGKANGPTPSPEKGRKRAVAQPVAQPEAQPEAQPVAVQPEVPWSQVVGRRPPGRTGKTAGAEGQRPQQQPQQQQQQQQQRRPQQQPQQQQQQQQQQRQPRVLPLRQEVPERRGKGPPQQRGGQPKAEKGGRLAKPPPKPRSFPRPPRTAAVVLTAPEGGYAGAMRLAQEKVNLSDLGIEALRPKRARTGALILEIPGADGVEKADRLAAAMARALSETEGVKVARPTKMVELRVRDLDEAATPQSIAAGIARACDCHAEGVKVGPIRVGPDGMGTAWAKCPLAAAAALAKTGKVKIGWLWSRVELLAARPLQCFKCMELGHVRQRCPNDREWGDRCFRCGQTGHRSTECSSSPRCQVCKDSGGPARHRLGGPACRATPVGGRSMSRGLETPANRRTALPPKPPVVLPVAAAAEEALMAAVEAPAGAAAAVEAMGRETPLPQRVRRNIGGRTTPPAETSVAVEAMEVTTGDNDEEMAGAGGAENDNHK